MISILGGGQLARMLALAAHPLGINIACLEPSANTSASTVTTTLPVDYTDLNKIKTLLDQTDVVTYENENIPLATADYIQQHYPFYPSYAVLSIAQDRLHEKNLFTKLGMKTAQFVAVDCYQDLVNGLKTLGYPAILKTRRFGYDGKGQYTLHSEADKTNAWQALEGKSLILEQFIHFDNEVSMIAVRDKQQNIRFYPLTENIHEQGILKLSLVPARPSHLQQQAEQHTQKILEHIDYIGVLAIEFFQVGDTLFANEMAPRVHNSGHWTIEGAVTSQFENHLRAICGLPLGNTDAKGYSAMFNCIGEKGVQALEII